MKSGSDSTSISADNEKSKRTTFFLSGALVTTFGVGLYYVHSTKVIDKFSIGNTLLSDQFSTYFLAASVLFLCISLLLLKRTIWLEARLLNEQQSLRLKRVNEQRRASFYAALAHELRTPIKSIIAAAQLRRITGESGEDDEIFISIEDSAKEVSRMIDELLDAERLSAGQYTLNAVEFDPLEIFESVISMCEMIAEERGVRLDFQFEGNVPEMLFGDCGRIRQIATNIIENAIKYSDTDSATKESCVSVRVGWEEGRALLLSVEDNGLGMSEETQRTIFDPYKRAASVEKSNLIGTGLGMSVTKAIIEAFNGSIEIESELGVGSCFKVSIPTEAREQQSLVQWRSEDWSVCLFGLSSDQLKLIVPLIKKWKVNFRLVKDIGGVESANENSVYIIGSAVMSYSIDELNQCSDLIGKRPILFVGHTGLKSFEHAGRARYIGEAPLYPSHLKRALIALTGQAVDADNTTSQKPCSILIVEDNRMYATMLSEVLTRLGHSVLIASDGSSAIEIWGGSEVDLIVTDFQMPVLDGPGMVKTIRALEKEHSIDPVFICGTSASNDNAEAAKCFSAGMNAFLIKPFNARDLQSMLTKARNFQTSKDCNERA